MERKQEVVRRLRQLDGLRLAVENMDRALQVLTPEERLVVQMLYICPERKAADKLCTLLHVEHSSVYRKKDQAMEKLVQALYN